MVNFYIDQYRSRLTSCQHRLSHRSLKHECIDCDAQFKTYGGMLIHLEYGNCTSGLNMFDVNKTAALCFQWKRYTDKDLRHELLKRRSPSEQPFYCPTCGVWFGKLSSLFQHVESPHCGQTLKAGAIGKLKNWLWAHHVYGVVAKFHK